MIIVVHAVPGLSRVILDEKQIEKIQSTMTDGIPISYQAARILWLEYFQEKWNEAGLIKDDDTTTKFEFIANSHDFIRSEGFRIDLTIGTEVIYSEISS